MVYIKLQYQDKCKKIKVEPGQNLTVDYIIKSMREAFNIDEKTKVNFKFQELVIDQNEDLKKILSDSILERFIKFFVYCSGTVQNTENSQNINLKEEEKIDKQQEKKHDESKEFANIDPQVGLQQKQQEQPKQEECKQEKQVETNQKIQEKKSNDDILSQKGNEDSEKMTMSIEEFQKLIKDAINTSEINKKFQNWINDFIKKEKGQNTIQQVQYIADLNYDKLSEYLQTSFVKTLKEQTNKQLASQKISIHPKPDNSPVIQEQLLQTNSDQIESIRVDMNEEYNKLMKQQENLFEATKKDINFMELQGSNELSVLEELQNLFLFNKSLKLNLENKLQHFQDKATITQKNDNFSGNEILPMQNQTEETTKKLSDMTEDVEDSDNFEILILKKQVSRTSDQTD